tara:strand:- start:388 stop:726 length:339 start_codon:yes stop_codon:yes gene_type:complete
MIPRADNHHQDWTPVVLNKPKEAKSKINHTNNTNKLDGDDIIVPMKIKYELKSAIQKARLASKKSQKQLALEMGVQSQLIAEYENGKAIPSNSFIAKLERKLNVKLPRDKKK